MKEEQIRYLAALREQGNLLAAASACAVASEDIRSELAVLEREYGHPLLVDESDDACLTDAGLMLAELGLRLREEKTQLQKEFAEARTGRILAPLTGRRSVSPKRLKGPGPTPSEIEGMVTAALCAPDHGGIHPWRLIQFAESDRPLLARLFAEEKLRRDPLAPQSDLDRAREHATRSPVLLAFVVSPQVREAVPVREQWLAAGAAIGNLMNAAHQLGFGAIMLSGERCYDPILCTALGIQSSEYLAGFISLGAVSVVPPPRHSRDPRTRMSLWKYSLETQ